MQKKVLIFLMGLICFTGYAHDTEYSVFSSMPEDARNQIPATLREEIDTRWKKEQEDKLAQEIDEYYGRDEILLKEFEKAGSIDEALKAKEASNAQTLANRKLQVCRCSRHRWPWQCYSPQTEVEKNDTVLENEIKKINLRYREAAAKHTEKSVVIKQVVAVAYTQFKKQIKLLEETSQSVNQCHGDLKCHEINGIFERRLAQDYREGMISQIFINAVKSCEQRNIAKEDILAQIWEKDPLLVKYQAKVKNLNNLIDVGLNPQLQEEPQQEEVEQN